MRAINTNQGNPKKKKKLQPTVWFSMYLLFIMFSIVILEQCMSVLVHMYYSVFIILHVVK